MFAINMNKGRAAHVSHAGSGKHGMKVTGIDVDGSLSFCVASITTTIDTSTNGNLCLHCYCSQEHHQADYGRLRSHFLTLNL